MGWLNLSQVNYSPINFRYWWSRLKKKNFYLLIMLLTKVDNRMLFPFRCKNRPHMLLPSTLNYSQVMQGNFPFAITKSSEVCWKFLYYSGLGSISLNAFWKLRVASNWGYLDKLVFGKIFSQKYDQKGKQCLFWISFNGNWCLWFGWMRREYKKKENRKKENKKKYVLFLCV